MSKQATKLVSWVLEVDTPTRTRTCTAERSPGWDSVRQLPGLPNRGAAENGLGSVSRKQRDQRLHGHIHQAEISEPYFRNHGQSEKREGHERVVESAAATP